LVLGDQLPHHFGQTLNTMANLVGGDLAVTESELVLRDRPALGSLKAIFARDV